MMLRIGPTVVAAAVFGASVFAAAATAQEFPNKTVSFVVPFPAGGTVDQVARAIASELEANWDQAVIVENRPGAGNIVGSTAVAQAQPDGHTLLLATTSVAANPALFASLPFDTETDLAPVVHLAASPNVLLVSPELGVDSLDAFIETARSSDSPISYGSVGRGSGHHICMAMLGSEADIELQHIPYAGVAPAVAAFRAGEVPAYCSDITGALSLIKEGHAIPLGVTGTDRVTALPDVPTMVELGLPGMDTAGFIGVMTTGGTPEDVVEQLNRDIRAVVEQPDFVDRFSALGYDMEAGTAAEFDAFIEENTQAYKDIVERAGIEVSQ